jgi:hypothetical protein
LGNVWKSGGTLATFAPMQYENIKFKKEIVERIRENKKKTGVPIATFAEKAVLDKLPPVEKISQKIKSSRKSPKQ